VSLDPRLHGDDVRGADPRARGHDDEPRTARLTLGDAPLAGLTGRGVLVAVVDSGVAAGHPHVGRVAGGVAIVAGGEHADFADRIGHGTAVAAAVREKAPDADLLAVKVFDRSLATTADALARAIRWAADRGARVVNLSLGTANPARAPLLRAAVAHAAARGAVVVSARAVGGAPSLPGALAGVVGVEADWAGPRDALAVDDGADGPVFRASAYPRPIPGVPAERNLKGISFAVANVTGFVARLLEAEPALADARDVARAVRRLAGQEAAKQ
jgi:subtilisin family serine protease